jgi:hypothetical protein
MEQDKKMRVTREVGQRDELTHMAGLGDEQSYGAGDG